MALVPSVEVLTAPETLLNIEIRPGTLRGSAINQRVSDVPNVVRLPDLEAPSIVVLAKFSKAPCRTTVVTVGLCIVVGVLVK